MTEFMYLFRGGDHMMASESPEVMQAHMQKWMVWMEQLGKEGKLNGGVPLKQGGKTVSPDGIVTDGPFAEGKELVGGYLIVRANDIDEATEISKGCPILEAGGSIEVREVQPSSL